MLKRRIRLTSGIFVCQLTLELSTLATASGVLRNRQGNRELRSHHQGHCHKTSQPSKLHAFVCARTVSLAVSVWGGLRLGRCALTSNNRGI